VKLFLGKQSGGFKSGRKTTNFMHQTDLTLISTIFIRWGCDFTKKYNNVDNIFSYFIDQRPEMLRKNTFYASN
jgi:hypothetical protein